MAKYNEKTLTGIYQRVVGAMSGLSDIGVEIHPQVCPHWDPKERKIRMPLAISYASNEEEDFTIGRSIVVHESSHVLFCPKFEWGNDNDLGEWFNVFADCNNEYKVTELWSHLKKPLKEKTDILLRKKPKLLKSDNPFMQVIGRCDMLGNRLMEFPEKYPDFLKEFIEQVTKEWKDKEVYKATGDKLIEFTKKVNEDWKLLKDEKDPTSEQAKKSQGDKVHKMMKELGDLIKKGASAEEIQEQQDKIAEQNKQAKWFKEDVDRRIVGKVEGKDGDYSDKTLEELKEMLKNTEKQVDVKKGASGGWGSDILDLGKCCKTQVRPYPNQYGNEEEPYDKQAAYKQGKKIHRALKKKVELQEDFEKRHRSGRIDIDEIRRQIGQLGRIHKETLFQRTNEFNRGGQWAIEVLIDCSGSMSGMKMSNAKQAFATLGYALDGLPNVKYALTGFNHADQIQDIQVKKFNDRRLDIRRLDLLHSGGGNADGYNIRSATKRLNKFKNIKKILVVISDGQPAYANGIEDSSKAVKRAEQLGIKVIGIGIEGATEKSLEHIYPKPYYFEDTESLHKDLTNLILAALGQRDKIKLVKQRWER